MIATADIAALAWPSLDPTKRSEAWITLALVYSSLALSVSSVLLALQQQSVLKSFDISRFLKRENVDLPPEKFDIAYEQDITQTAKAMIRLVLAKIEDSTKVQYRLDIFRLYVWQAPAMSMSYSALLFICGFSLHTVYPLFLIGKTGWTAEVKVCLSETSTMKAKVWKSLLTCGPSRRR